MTHLSEELQQRMVALVRDIANFPLGGEVCWRSIELNKFGDEARAIAALLPDPDLEAAKDIVAAVWRCPASAVSAEHDAVQIALAGIRHARTQAKE